MWIQRRVGWYTAPPIFMPHLHHLLTILWLVVAVVVGPTPQVAGELEVLGQALVWRYLLELTTRLLLVAAVTVVHHT
jgi:hypothetical protein